MSKLRVKKTKTWVYVSKKAGMGVICKFFIFWHNQQEFFKNVLQGIKVVRKWLFSVSLLLKLICIQYFFTMITYQVIFAFYSPLASVTRVSNEDLSGSPELIRIHTYAWERTSTNLQQKTPRTIKYLRQRQISFDNERRRQVRTISNRARLTADNHNRRWNEYLSTACLKRHGALTESSSRTFRFRIIDICGSQFSKLLTSYCS